MSGQPMFRLRVPISRETDKAIQLDLSSTRQIWVPKSLVSVDGDLVDMPLWLADKKGLT